MYNKKAFTLIELLVVIAIIGLLASIVLVSVNKARAKARDAKRLSDFRNLVSALEMYYDDHNDYPPNPHPGWACSFPCEANCLNELITGGYLSSLPRDPKGGCYNYYNYGPSSHGAVIHCHLETKQNISPCTFTTGCWCDYACAGPSTYCICLK